MLYWRGERCEYLEGSFGLSKSSRELNGEFFPEITRLFPNQEVLPRNTKFWDFEDEKIWKPVQDTDREKIVVSRLWTGMCFVYTVLHGLKEGKEVYGLIDAACGSTRDAHRMVSRECYGLELFSLLWIQLQMYGTIVKIQSKWASSRSLFKIWDYYWV